MMTSVTLKRLLGRKKEATLILSNFIDTLGSPIRIFDADGNVLLGTTDINESAMRYPIEFEGETLGWVTGDEKVELVASLTIHLVKKNAENRALATEVLDLYREVNLLHDLSEKLTASLDIATVTEAFLTEASRLITCTCGAVILRQDETDILETIAGFGINFSSAARHEVGKGIIGTVVQDGKAEIINDTRNDARFAETDGPYNSMVCAALKTSQWVMGVIVLTGSENITYTSGDLKLLSTLASQAAPAIENAMLHQKTLREAEEREKRRLQEQEIRYLKKINKMKDELVRMVSHDLKNPIGVITGYSQLIESNNYIQDAQGLNFLKRIQISADKMNTLVTDLLDLARIEEGVTLAMQAVPLDKFLKQRIEEFEFTATSKEIDLVFSPSPPITLMIDPDRLGQVISNLLSNAIKYSPHHRRVQLDVSRESDSVVIRVMDNGLGIPKDDLPHLFDKFYRVSRKEHMASEGTGLGLAIVKAIVDKHHGTIWVESELGVGSTFNIRLPMTQLPSAS